MAETVIYLRKRVVCKSSSAHQESPSSEGLSWCVGPSGWCRNSRTVNSGQRRDVDRASGRSRGRGRQPPRRPPGLRWTGRPGRLLGSGRCPPRRTLLASARRRPRRRLAGEVHGLAEVRPASLRRGFGPHCLDDRVLRESVARCDGEQLHERCGGPGPPHVRRQLPIVDLDRESTEERDQQPHRHASLAMRTWSTLPCIRIRESRGTEAD
jgi:hypothetical protein